MNNLGIGEKRQKLFKVLDIIGPLIAPAGFIEFSGIETEDTSCCSSQ
jgi:hypothetical protein